MIPMKHPGNRFPIVLLNITGVFLRHTMEKPQSTASLLLLFQHRNIVMLKSYVKSLQPKRHDKGNMTNLELGQLCFLPWPKVALFPASLCSHLSCMSCTVTSCICWGSIFCPFSACELNICFLLPTHVRVYFDLAEISLSKGVCMYVFKKS